MLCQSGNDAWMKKGTNTLEIASEVLGAVAGVSIAGAGGGFIFLGAAAVPVIKAAI